VRAFLEKDTWLVTLCRVGKEPEALMEILIAKYLLHPIIDHFTIAFLAVGVLADIVGNVIALTIEGLASKG
jgi:hypothetical protein